MTSYSTSDSLWVDTNVDDCVILAVTFIWTLLQPGVSVFHDD